MTSKGINWNSKKDLLEWKDVAAEKQRFYYEFFRRRRWEMYEPPEFPYLKLKIGYALFGPPVDVKNVDIDNFYNAAQKKKIEDVFNALKKVNSKEKFIVVSFIFFIAVIDNKYTEFPVFRALKSKQGNETEICNFVDSIGYLYKNWEKFLATNIIPYCIYCYPKGGFYTCDAAGTLELEYSYCPQSYSILSGVVSAVGTVGSAVGTVGSAVGTVIPGSRNTQAELLPIPCISIVKGIIGRNRLYWIPVTFANGSTDLYGVHSTYSLAQSSQVIRKVPSIISDALENGYVNITWYAVLNEIENIIQHSIITSYMHVAQIISSALFFCHVVLSTDLTKQIIKEIRTDINKCSNVNLDHFKTVSLKDSLEISRKNIYEPVVRQLKFIDTREILVNEIIEKTYQTNFMVPDELGKYYTLASLLENIENSTDPKKYANILTNYCLVLENTIKYCKYCCDVLEEQGKFISVFDKNNCSLSEEFEVLKPQEQEVLGVISDVDIDKARTPKQWSFKSISFSRKNKADPSSTPSKDKTPNKEMNLETPIKGNSEFKDTTNNEWYLTSVYNVAVSPFVTSTPNKTSHGKIEESQLDVLDKLEKGEFKVIKNSLSNENSPKKNQTPISKPTTDMSNNLHESTISNDCDVNIHTPNFKNYQKAFETIGTPINNKHGLSVSPEHTKTLEISGSPSNIGDVTLNEDNQVINTESAVTLEETEYKSPSQKEGLKIIKDEPDSQSIDDKLNNLEVLSKSVVEKSVTKEDNLSGKSFEITREELQDEIDPLFYFREYVQNELNNIEAYQYSSNEHEENCWQYVLPREVRGVKVVKIKTSGKQMDKELISISYY